MDLQSGIDQNCHLNSERSHYASFYLVGELLVEVLGRNDETLTFTSESGDFLYDPDSSIPITGSLKKLTTCSEVTETGSKAEISINGVVENEKEEKYSFSMYFSLNRNEPVKPGQYDSIGSAMIDCLSTRFRDTQMILHDALFHLSLIRLKDSGEQCMLGSGRGFLVFNPTIL